MRFKSWAMLGSGLLVLGSFAGIAKSQFSSDAVADPSGVIQEARAKAEEARAQIEEAKARVAEARVSSPFVEVSLEPDIKVRTASSRAISVVAKQLRDAPNEEQRQAARKKLAEYLDKYFDDDLKNREAEIENVEKRVEKLRSLIDKRASKKQEIIELQLKVFENDADGLGFFSSSDSGGGHGMIYGRGELPRVEAKGMAWSYGGTNSGADSAGWAVGGVNPPPPPTPPKVPSVESLKAKGPKPAKKGPPSPPSAPPVKEESSDESGEN